MPIMYIFVIFALVVTSTTVIMYRYNYNDALKLRKQMNRQFRVKVGRSLVGFSGLAVAVGLEKACELIRRALLSSCDVFAPRALCSGLTIKFYVR